MPLGHGQFGWRSDYVMIAPSRDQREREDYRGPVSSLIPFHFQTFGLQPRPPLQYIYQMLYSSPWSHRRVYIIYIFKYTEKKTKQPVDIPFSTLRTACSRGSPVATLKVVVVISRADRGFENITEGRRMMTETASQWQARTNSEHPLSQTYSIKYESEGTASACLIRQHCSYIIEIQKSKPPCFFYNLMLTLIIEQKKDVLVVSSN